ncbi:hypothetical protein [Streptomyces lavendulae]
MLLSKTRERFAQRRLRNDRELITYGAHFALRNDYMPVLCSECGRYGNVLGAVAARTAAGVSLMDRECARDKEAQFLHLSECVQRAAQLGIPLKSDRAPSPIDMLTVEPDYENSAIVFNATSGKARHGHVAQMGAARRRG